MPTGQETRLPSAPERGETMELAGSASCVTTATSMATAKEAAGKQSAPEMGNRKSSARNSGSARGGITSVERSKALSDVAASVRREERQLIARRLYDIELTVGLVFGTVDNLNDCNLAGEQLERLLEHVAGLRKEYES